MTTSSPGWRRGQKRSRRGRRHGPWVVGRGHICHLYVFVAPASSRRVVPEDKSTVIIVAAVVVNVKVTTFVSGLGVTTGSGEDGR